MHTENYGVYGIRNMHAQLAREGVLGASGQRPVARCTTQRLMRQLGPRGVSRAKGPRTTVPGSGPDTRPDLVERQFTADAPDQLWVADITYCRTFAGWVYAAFVVDVFSRRVVGWQLSTSLRTDLALDALNMGLWAREGHDTSALVHHSDRGVQYLAVRYTERLAEAGVVASVGRKGDSYDNALAEAFNSLFKAELIRNRGPLKSLDELEIAVAEYIDWFNFRRLHGEIGLIPPVEYEAQHRSTALPKQPAQRQSECPANPVHTWCGSRCSRGSGAQRSHARRDDGPSSGAGPDALPHDHGDLRGAEGLRRQRQPQDRRAVGLPVHAGWLLPRYPRSERRGRGVPVDPRPAGAARGCPLPRHRGHPVPADAHGPLRRSGAVLAVVAGARGRLPALARDLCAWGFQR